jgi:TonB-linked SusC/RagA family outer membrane protein
MKKILNTIVLLFVFSLFVYSQNEKTITGTVNSGDESVPGVSISIKGTALGTVSDVNGKYSISAKPTDVLIFSFVGFAKVEEPVNNRTTIDAKMVEQAVGLEEVIAIGYGTVKKKDLTGAISTVKGEELAKRNVANISQALQGQLAGVQVISNGGAPGTEPFVLVRGITTINNNKPLYVVDDVPLDDISWLNPKDIENVQVLKDASSSAIFGSRASNGVIIIETKKAKAGKTNIIFDGSYSIQSVAKKPELANATEYALIANKASKNSGLSPVFSDPEALGAGTDWWNQVTQLAPIQNYSLNINKGSEELKISTGLSYFNQEGVVKGGGYQRWTLRLNTEYKLTKRITIGENVSISKDKTKNGPEPIWGGLLTEPVIPVYLPEYEQEGKNEFSIFHPTTFTDGGNPMGELARSFNTTDYMRTVGNLFARINIIEGLNVETKFAFYLSEWENNWFSPDYYIEPTDRNDINSVGRSHNNRTNYTWNNIVSYTKDFGDHNLNAMAGAALESFEHRSLNASAKDLPSNHVDLRYLDAATDAFWASGTNENHTQTSFLGRIQYSYKDKYLINTTFRADASSRFPEANKWGYFPSVSGAWNIAEESFMEDVEWLTQLKIRVGWGQLGNQNIPNNATLTTLGKTYYIFGADEDVEIGMAPETVGNQDLKWETVEDFNIGLDLGLFEQKLTFAIDYFNRTSKDMLMEKSIPLYLGSVWSTPWSNIGSLNTTGFELVINYRETFGNDFELRTSLNLSRANTEMTKLASGEAIWAGNHQRLDMLTRTVEGGVAGEFYGWKTNGIFQNESEIINYTDEFGNILQPLAQPGDMKFKDLNGDGTINGEDRKVIGDPEPDFSYGLNINMEYKSFDIYMLFNGTVGNDVLNAVKPYTHAGNGIYNSYQEILNTAWAGEGTSDTQPRLAVRDNNQNFRYSDYYIEDGSYLRLQSAQLGYNLPKAFCNKLTLTKARVYIGGENLFTVTNFSGMDPDIGGSALERGIDWGHYPVPRVFMVGVNISF